MGFISSLPNPQRLSTNWWWFLHYLFRTGGIWEPEGSGGHWPSIPFCLVMIEPIFVLTLAFTCPPKGNIFDLPSVLLLLLSLIFYPLFLLLLIFFLYLKYLMTIVKEWLSLSCPLIFTNLAWQKSVTQCRAVHCKHHL